MLLRSISEERDIRAGTVQAHSSLEVHRNGAWTWKYQVHDNAKIVGDNYAIGVLFLYHSDATRHCLFDEGVLGALLGNSDYSTTKSGLDEWIHSNWWNVLRSGTQYNLHRSDNTIEGAMEVLFGPALGVGYVLQYLNTK